MKAIERIKRIIEKIELLEKLVAEYGDEKALMDIKTGELIGKLKPTARALVDKWRLLHLDELLENWELLQKKGTFFKIEPLE